MATTIVIPASADIGAFAPDVADDYVTEKGSYDPRLAQKVIDLATAASTDINALQAGTTITGVNGVTMPAGGALATGSVLRATGASTAAYGQVNLADTDAVTGILPAGNFADAVAGAAGGVRLAGDLAGTGSAAATPRVGAINSATVPAGGALTTGNVLQVSGASALSYAALNLAGGANFVTGVLPAANVDRRALGAYYARGVVVGNVADLNTFTVAGNDGLTYAENEVVLLVGQSTASQSGPYVVGAVGGGTAALTRPTWWAAAAVIPGGAEFRINEGTAWANSVWFASLAGSITVGTSEPAFFPRKQSGTTAAMAGAPGTINVPSVWLLSTTLSHISYNVNTKGGTQGFLECPVAGRTAGAGSGEFDVTSTANETSTISWCIFN